MQDFEQIQRPTRRIGHVLETIKRVWPLRYELSLVELVLEATLAANAVPLNLPDTNVHDIEDIDYPSGSLFQGRSLELGLAELEKLHGGQSSRCIPFQIAWLGEVEAAWRQHPQLRLGQLLFTNYLRAEAA